MTAHLQLLVAILMLIWIMIVMMIDVLKYRGQPHNNVDVWFMIRQLNQIHLQLRPRILNYPVIVVQPKLKIH